MESAIGNRYRAKVVFSKVAGISAGHIYRVGFRVGRCGAPEVT